LRKAFRFLCLVVMSSPFWLILTAAVLAFAEASTFSADSYSHTAGVHEPGYDQHAKVAVGTNAKYHECAAYCSTRGNLFPE